MQLVLNEDQELIAKTASDFVGERSPISRVRELRDSVAELTNHLREGIADEYVYQRWYESHSWAFGNAYVVNDTLRSISATDQVDLLLPLNLGGFRDLIEKQLQAVAGARRSTARPSTAACRR